MFLTSSCSYLCPIQWSQVLRMRDVGGPAPTGDAPTTSQWSTILLPNKEVSYIRGFTVISFSLIAPPAAFEMWWGHSMPSFACSDFFLSTPCIQFRLHRAWCRSLKEFATRSLISWGLSFDFIFCVCCVIQAAASFSPSSCIPYSCLRLFLLFRAVLSVCPLPSLFLPLLFRFIVFFGFLFIHLSFLSCFLQYLIWLIVA